ncbi:MAG: ABC transporter ATP-binding protein [Spirochaetales bacterium]|nr:ABC transporter ATP-binding protein [Spirochaetales bacterium]
MTEKESTGNVIETTGLTKYYGKVKAVDNISISVKKGEIYGFLGLNGAGKTTTIRMLLGMVQPLSGKAFVAGKRIVPGKPGPWDKVGYLVELPFSYPELTVRENLTAVSRLRRLTKKNAVSEIISLLKLHAYEKVKARHLSLGNSQRLGLAKALIHQPEILILDEPANGLDPAGIVEIRELLKDYAENRGVTVFVSSHNLSEISKTATRIGIIHSGFLVQEIDTDKLDSFLDTYLLIKTRNNSSAASFLSGKGIIAGHTDDGSLRVTDPAACEKPEQINTLLVNAGFPPFYLKVQKEDLESYFLKIIGSLEL